jgi:hypothetical protein
MGRYIEDTTDETKEAFLDRFGTDAINDIGGKFLPIKSGNTLICLVDNGPFTAAAICDNVYDYRRFIDVEDSRPKKWFWVPHEFVKSKLY